MKHLCCVLITLVISSLPVVSKAAATAAGSNGMWRAEFAATATLDFGKFDETKSGTTYENTTYGYGLGGFLHAGMRFGSISVGPTLAVDGLTGSLGRRTAATVGSNPAYSFTMSQGLAGGYIGWTLWGDVGGPEIFGEYYAAAHRTVTESEAGNGPFKKFDSLNGTGWGAGLSFSFDPRFRVGLLYRSFVFNNLNLGGTPDPVTRTDFATQSASAFFGARF